MNFFELDVHTHTISSGHYTKATVTDMVKQAAARNIQLLGISEHGPSMPHSCTPSYFRGLSQAPSVRMGVHILYGAEVNIVSEPASSAKAAPALLDLSDDIMKNLDYCLAGMHLPCRTPGSVSENTAAYIQAMANPYIKIIAHPDDASFPVDYERLTEAAMDYHVLLEINNSSLAPDGYRGDTKENNRTVLNLCRKYRYPVLLSSDSHGCSNIGNFTYAINLIRETGFPQELILNTSARRFLDFLAL